MVRGEVGAVVAIGPRGEVFLTLSVGEPGVRVFGTGDNDVDFARFGAVSTNATPSSEPDSSVIESPSSAGAATPKVAVDVVAPSDDIARRMSIGTDPYNSSADHLSEGDYMLIHVGLPTLGRGGSRATAVPVTSAPTDRQYPFK